MYSAKWTQKDRKGDIELICSIKPSEDLPQFDHVDVTVNNTSNRSINFDLDLKIFKQDGLLIMPKYQIQREIVDDFRQAINYMPPMGVSTSERDDHFLIATSLKKGVTLLQNDRLTDILDENAMILMTKEDLVLSCEVLVRSDDFIEGMLIRKIDLPVSRR